MADLAQSADLFDPKELAKLGGLDLIATRIVEGFLSGKHRSPYLGSSIEFAEHRAYSPGDEIRLIDWRVYGRSDRHYIKKFELETNLQAWLVLDTSGSMGWSLSTITKLHYARMAAAALIQLMLKQRDAVGLACANTTISEYIPPRSNPGHFAVLTEVLNRTQAGGQTALARVLHEMTVRLRRRGLIIIFSDCFDELEPLRNALYHLRLKGHELLLFHVLAPEERSFSFDRWSRFECIEGTGRSVELDPVAIRSIYLEQVKNFVTDLQRICAEVHCDYVAFNTDESMVNTLAYYLARRSARMK